MSMHERKLDLPEMIKQSFSFILKKNEDNSKKAVHFFLIFQQNIFLGCSKNPLNAQ